MKIASKSLALIIFCIVSFLACKEDDDLWPDAGSGYGNHPRTEVPDELVGYWQAGSFSMSSFSDYDGSYAGQAYEISTGYKFFKN